MKQVFLVGCLFIIFFIDFICISAVHRIRKAIGDSMPILAAWGCHGLVATIQNLRNLQSHG